MNARPRISVNKLAEYMVSKGRRQREILRDQKFPQDFKVTYYKEAEQAASRCMASNFEDTAILVSAIEVLEQRTSEKVGTVRRINGNIDAIEAFAGMMDQIDFKGGMPELGEHAPPRGRIHDVDISVRPEIVLRGEGKGGQPLVGALKLHFPKSFALNEESAGFVSAILQRYAEMHLATGNQNAYWAYCSVADVGSRRFYPGVRSIAARIRDVESECRNIAAIWASLNEDE